MRIQDVCWGVVGAAVGGLVGVGAGELYTHKVHHHSQEKSDEVAICASALAIIGFLITYGVARHRYLTRAPLLDNSLFSVTEQELKLRLSDPRTADPSPTSTAPQP